MFGIGIPEILIIALVAIIFLNPKDLPGLFRNLGKSYQQVKRMREDFMKEVTDIKNGFDVVGGSSATKEETASRPSGPEDEGVKSPSGDEKPKDDKEGEVT